MKTKMKNVSVCILFLLLTVCVIKVPAGNNERVDVKNSTDLYQQFDGDILALLQEAETQQKSIVVAHRGGIAPGFVENSKSAFQRVIHALPVIIEIDVVATLDGVNVLHHDKTLERTTTGKGLPSDMNWSELSKLKLKDQSNRVLEEGILRLDEFLVMYSRKAFLMIDMKSPSSNAAVVKLVDEHGMLESTVFIAYNLEQAKSIRLANPDAILALGVKGPNYLTNIREAGFAQTPFISLTGDIQQDSKVFENISAEDHYILAGSYLGDMPLDAVIEMAESVPVKSQVSKAGRPLPSKVRLIVSNQPFAMQRFLCSNNAGLLCSI
jgi:glycerophosphoryl diester phosphodiesterase